MFQLLILYIFTIIAMKPFALCTHFLCILVSNVYKNWTRFHQKYFFMDKYMSSKICGVYSFIKDMYFGSFQHGHIGQNFLCILFSNVYKNWRRFHENYSFMDKFMSSKICGVYSFIKAMYFGSFQHGHIAQKV